MNIGCNWSKALKFLLTFFRLQGEFLNRVAARLFLYMNGTRIAQTKKQISDYEELC